MKEAELDTDVWLIFNLFILPIYLAFLLSYLNIFICIQY